MFSPQCPVNYEVFQSSWWEQVLFPALCECCVLLPVILLSESFPGFGYFASMHMLTYLLKVGAPPQISSILSLQSSHPRYAVLQTLAFLVFLDPQLHLPNWKNLLGPP